MITFITSSDFIESAKWLDKKRLWKQVLEARQLLERIELVKFLCNYYGEVYPSREMSPAKKYDLIRVVMKKLRKKNYTPIWVNDYSAIDYIPSASYKERSDKVKFGHIYHPIVPLWMGYEEALKYYIYIHHEECLFRGIKSSLCIEEEDPPSTYPPWISCIVHSHRRILLRKLPEAYPQWSSLEPLDKLDWDELYSII